MNQYRVAWHGKNLIPLPEHDGDRPGAEVIVGPTVHLSTALLTVAGLAKQLCEPVTVFSQDRFNRRDDRTFVIDGARMAEETPDRVASELYEQYVDDLVADQVHISELITNGLDSDEAFESRLEKSILAWPPVV